MKVSEHTALIKLDSQRDLFTEHGLHMNNRGKKLAAKKTIHHKVYAKYRVRQANFLFHMAFHIQKRKLACRTINQKNQLFIVDKF
jgi:hypothetical protein